jgi:hypothetical protein
VGGERQSCCFWATAPWWEKKCKTVLCRDATASSFIGKVWGKVFAHFLAVAVEGQGSMRNWLFGLPKLIICEQFPWCQRKCWACSWLFPSPVLRFWSQWVWTFPVRLMVSFLNVHLLFTRVSVSLFPRFAQYLMLFLCRIHREIASVQMHDCK